MKKNPGGITTYVVHFDRDEKLIGPKSLSSQR